MYGDTECKLDYVTIPGGSADGLMGPDASRDRYCGTALGSCTFDGTTGGACVKKFGSVISKLLGNYCTLTTL